MKTKITVVEVKQDKNIRYVGRVDEYSQRATLVDSLNEAEDFTDKGALMIRILGSFRYPDSTVSAFSAISIDKAEVVEIEVSMTEVSRKNYK